MVFEPYVRFHSLGSWVVACFEMAAHSACGVFFKYKCLIVNLVFPASVFWRLRLLLIIAYLYLF